MFAAWSAVRLSLLCCGESRQRVRYVPEAAARAVIRDEQLPFAIKSFSAAANMVGNNNGRQLKETLYVRPRGVSWSAYVIIQSAAQLHAERRSRLLDRISNACFDGPCLPV
jgi:hypothetical protein